MGILKKFLDVSMTKNFPEEGGMATLTKYFNEIVPPSIDVCVRLGKIEFLFDKVTNIIKYYINLDLQFISTNICTSKFTLMVNIIFML